MLFFILGGGKINLYFTFKYDMIGTCIKGGTVQLLKILQKEKINSPEIKEYGNLQVKLETEVNENQNSNLIGTIHPTWYKDFNFPKEVFASNLPICYMHGIVPENTIVESVFFFYDLVFNKSLVEFKEGDKTCPEAEFLQYVSRVPDVLLEAISIQPYLFVKHISIVSHFVKSNMDNEHVQNILDSMFDLVSSDEYLLNFPISKKIDLAIKDFYTKSMDIFPDLSPEQMSKIIDFTHRFGHEIEPIIDEYADIPNIRLIAQKYITPRTFAERFASIKKVSYTVHEDDIDKAFELIGNTSMHYRTMQSEGCDLEYLGMNQIRKSDLVTYNNIEVLHESLPFVSFDIDHRIVDNSMTMAASIEGKKAFEFSYMLHGNEVYNVNVLFEEDESLLWFLTKSKNSMAIWMILSSMAKRSDCLLSSQVAEKFKVN